ncbi:MAG: hypothetical protein Q7T99_17400 [Pseudomonas sp.]|nr:hypothetical protein [Pseudomonas sp.]
MRTLVILVGLQGSGKSTALNRIASETSYRVLQPSTTRAPRYVGDTEYDYVDQWVDTHYAWTIDVGGSKYGMRKSQLEEIDQVGITVFHPAHIGSLAASATSRNFEIVTVGLDTISDLAAQHQRVNNEGSRKATQATFDADKIVVQNCDIVIRGNEETIFEAVFEIANLLGGRGGVLGKKTISTLIKADSLLQEADSKRIQTASYDLVLADKYWCQGKYHTLTLENPTAHIPPYSFVLVQATETAVFPRFICGTFDLRVKLFFSGVVLSNGPQVDPGYQGGLFCMLYNASGSPVGLNRGQHFATIQFQTLSSNSADGYMAQYQGKRDFTEFLDGNDSQKPGGQILEYINSKHSEIKSTFNINLAAFWAIVAIFAGIAIWQLTSLSESQKKVGEDIKEITKSVESAAESAKKIENQRLQLDKDVNSFNKKRTELDEALESLKSDISSYQRSIPSPKPTLKIR